MRSFLLVLDALRNSQFDLEQLFETYESYEAAPRHHAAPSSTVAELPIPWGSFDNLVILFEDLGHEEREQRLPRRIATNVYSKIRSDACKANHLKAVCICGAPVYHFPLPCASLSRRHPPDHHAFQCQTRSAVE